MRRYIVISAIINILYTYVTYVQYDKNKTIIGHTYFSIASSLQVNCI